MLDTESGRGELYADVIPGGYSVLPLTEPFSPGRYIEAIKVVESKKPAVLVVDSGSHEWEGIGGVTDMATEEESRGMKGLGVWKRPKMEHARFMLKLLQSPFPVIVCLRAKHKSRQAKNEQGKTVILRDEFTTPTQAADFIFEMTAHFEILPDHTIRLTKCSHPTLKDCFPVGEPITVSTGECIARWCANPGKPASTQAQLPSDKKHKLMARLWKLLPADIRGAEKSWDKAEQQLRQWQLLEAAQHVRDLNDEQIVEVIVKTEDLLNQM